MFYNFEIYYGFKPDKKCQTTEDFVSFFFR